MDYAFTLKTGLVLSILKTFFFSAFTWPSKSTLSFVAGEEKQTSTKDHLLSVKKKKERETQDGENAVEDLLQ